ncbi:MAG: aminotransferase class V-fold PLP-dependent enzyme [Phycisphaerales bacterium]|nr:aminotransferase class V-fold PLP-dependent enzyme [Phycisphaerales bacterium]
MTTFARSDSLPTATPWPPEPAPAQGETDLARPMADRGLWAIDPALTFLNHGSYGACPRVVLDRQRELRERMERDPVRFFMQDIETLMDRTRDAVGALIDADPASLAPAPNSTVACATVLRHIAWNPGDEIIVSHHEYSSCINEIGRLAQSHDVRPVHADLPAVLDTPEQVIEATLKCVTPRTRLCLVSHVTSCGGAVLPVERLVALLRERGVETLVDGAHTPGQIELSVRRIGAAYYVAGLHKWCATPKGGAFISVRDDLRSGFRPLSLSSRAAKKRTDRDLYRCDFEYVGTADYTGHLCVPDAFAFMASLSEGGWPAVMRRNLRLARAASAMITSTLREVAPHDDVRPLCAEGLMGAMASVRLPACPPDLATRLAKDRWVRMDDPFFRPLARTLGDPVQDALVERYNIQTPVWKQDGPAPEFGKRFIRVCAHPSLCLGDFEHLCNALREMHAR